VEKRKGEEVYCSKVKKGRRTQQDFAVGRRMRNGGE
jgi:hypothetical protein